MKLSSAASYGSWRLAATAVTAVATLATTAAAVEPPQLQCGLWMAGSTLGDTTNLGMYAGVDIPVDVDVQQEIAIPLLFRNWDTPDYHETDDGQLWDRYIWEGEVADLATYDNTDLTQTKAVFVPGIGCTINSVLDMHNVESTHGSTYDTAGLHRHTDPGSGAFTPYYGTHTISTEPIEAGSEIFAAYGDTWIPDIPGAQVTFNTNLEAAEDFLRDDYYRFVESKKDSGGLKANVLEGLWNFTRDFPVTDNHIFTVLPRKVEWKEIAAQLKEKMSNHDTEDDDDIDDTIATTNDGEDDFDLVRYDSTNMVTRHFIREQSKKPLEWLQRYGRCCDHIHPLTSTIPQAGRGAFATRDLPKGTIVGYSPLVHVGLEAEKLFQIPYGANDKDNYVPEPDIEELDYLEQGYTLQDLVINYSFRHAESTINLTPYGSMVNYINHASKGYEANVKVIWPSEEMVAHKPEFLEKNITELRHTIEKIGLSFDYVAIHDIKEGEEVLLDYGPAWEAAWAKHVAEWKPLDDSEEYMHSTEWPADEPLRTEAEQDENPYPDNIETMCVDSYTMDPNTGIMTWLPVLRKTVDRVACTVVDRIDPPPGSKANAMPTYTVDMFISSSEDGEDNTVLQVNKVPHKDIFVVDRVKTADWHMPNVFRHPIAIPDDVLPALWKNKKAVSSSTKSTKKKASPASTSMPAGASASGRKDEL